MTLFALEGKAPIIAEGTYVSPAAHIIGDVRIGAGCWIGPGAVIRADFSPIRIGNETAIEENCVVHAPPGAGCRIGDRVTIGHGAVVHCALVDDCATVGMGSVLGMEAKVGRWSIVGEGSVVKSRQEIPPDTIVAGVPAQRLRDLDEAHKEFWRNGKRLYAELARRYLDGLVPL